MITPEKIESIARKIHQSMPQPIKELGADVESKIKQVLQAQFERLELVSREEFDVQTQVLLKTRQKLTDLEQKFSEIEKRLPQGDQDQIA